MALGGERVPTPPIIFKIYLIKLKKKLKTPFKESSYSINVNAYCHIRLLIGSYASTIYSSSSSMDYNLL